MPKYEVIGGCTKCGGALDTREFVDLAGGSIWKKISYCLNCGSSNIVKNPMKEKKNERHVDLFNGQKLRKFKKKNTIMIKRGFMKNDCIFYEIRGKTTKYGYCLILLEPKDCFGEIALCYCNKMRQDENKAYYYDWNMEYDRENKI